MRTSRTFASRRRLAIIASSISVILASFLAFVVAPAMSHASGTAFIRINQLGYATTATKRAYLMASAAETGATFAVKNASGVTVASGSIGASLGTWSSAYPDVYGIDFDGVTTSGTYTIAVNGPISATSPSFGVDTAANLYTGALGNALSFYQNERDGPNYIPSALRTAPGHLNDTNAMTYLTPNMNSNGRFSGDLTPLNIHIDASGGWWDAGDYLKFVETTSYTVVMQQLGVRDFPNQLGTGSTTSNFTAEAKFGLTFLQHMWDDSTKTLYYQVGIGRGNSKTISDSQAAQMASSGATVAEVCEGVRSILARIRVFFLVESLEYLRRNGRIGRAQALLGSVADAHPILTLQDGVITPIKTVRPRERALVALRELALSQGNVELMVISTSSPEFMSETENLMQAQYTGRLLRTWLGPTIGANMGPAIGVVVVVR